MLNLLTVFYKQHISVYVVTFVLQLLLLFIIVTFLYNAGVKMIVRIQILKKDVVAYNWAIFIVDETKQLKDIFSSINQVCFIKFMDYIFTVCSINLTFFI